ncbi:hypothetical protein H6758_03230 [Candidatus Nomurabacteria bacterium]|nr:hypothetical protein [Candidatus Nomurabacteria bacterium]
MKHLDIVIGGPDMSGTSTQIQDCIDYFLQKGKKIRDIRRTEIDALFHADIFSVINQDHLNLSAFLQDNAIPETIKSAFLKKSYSLLSGHGTNKDLRIASCVQNEVSTYIDPDSADVWIMEEPTKRSAGQVNRTIEQHRSKYGGSTDPIAAALSHQNYRIDEFLRFRKPLREAKKVIIRSRSEESACYQVYHRQKLPEGISMEDYLNLPGHAFAFGHPPTHIIIVCAPPEWNKEAYLKLKQERSNGRLIDDHESNAEYQLLVNRRYATNWLENLYNRGCSLYGATPPKIIRLNIYDSKQIIRKKLHRIFDLIAKN